MRNEVEMEYLSEVRGRKENKTGNAMGMRHDKRLVMEKGMEGKGN